MQQRRRSRKGTGTLWKPKGGSFYLRIRIGGVSRTFKTNTADRTEAERVRRRYVSEMEQGHEIHSFKVTLGKLAAEVLRDYQINNYKSIEDLRHRFDKHILRFFGPGTIAREIRPAHVEAFKAQRQREGAANGEVNRELEALNRAFNRGRELGYSLPAFKIIKLPEQKKRTTYWNEAEIAALLKVWPSDWTRPLIQFMNLTGWRVSEVQALTWAENVDWQARHVILREGKTKSGEPRVFPFITEFEELLSKQFEVTKKIERQKKAIIPWVFHRAGRQIHSFNKEWYAAMKAGKFIGKKRHDFRSTAARRLVRVYGLSPDIARRMVGWSSASMLDYYMVTEAADIHKAVSALNTSKNKSKTTTPVKQMK